jgi:Acetoacetate decarboxylase (ADC)
MASEFRLVKTIEHVMETLFMIDVNDAAKLLPGGLKPYSFLGKGLLQLSSLKYNDLKFEGKSLGPCTDVYAAVAASCDGDRFGTGLNGYCVCFYNNSEEIVHLVNENWFFNKKYAEIDWKRTERGHYSVSVTLEGEHILDYSGAVISGILVLPVLQRTRHALTLSQGTVYAFDNIFGKRFGVYACPLIDARGSLGWFAGLKKLRFYSIMWLRDTLKITDAMPIANRVGDHLEQIQART